MKPIDRRYKFEECAFERVRAHGGERAISFARVLSRNRGSLRFIDLSVVPASVKKKSHTHATDNEELYVVISGKGLMMLDGREFEVGPGDVVLNQPGGTHGLLNVGDEELRIVVIEVSQP